jgi:Ca-activated chloride channel family protein
MCWGLIVLLQLDGNPWTVEDQPGERQTAIHHLVVALDVSPSMQLKDAGPKQQQTRAERARNVVRSILDRLDLRRTRVSIVAFYTEARPVVVDTFDQEVVANILDDLPLEHAFDVGKTNMYDAVKSAAGIANTWREKTATFVMLSDGDTLPAKQVPRLPASFGNTLVLGVGNPHQGMFIDGHSSRQDARSLKQLALQLGGLYADTNSRQLSTDELLRLAASLPTADRGDFQFRDAAILAVVIGAVLLALIAPALALAGSPWSPRRARRFETFDLEVRLMHGEMQ